MGTKAHAYHDPVLLSECLRVLNVRGDGVYVDGTLGGGGHFREIVKRLGAQGVALGIDQDPEALEWNREHMDTVEATVKLEQGRFSQIGEFLAKNGIGSVDGVLLDLGVSSHQIDQPRRGFSFMHSENLDMRMNPDGPVSADEVLHSSTTDELTEILRTLGEIRNPSRMARAVVSWRTDHSLKTVGDLKQCFRSEYGSELPYKILAKVFQALRIAVNDELGELRRFLSGAADIIAPGGVLAIIAYHSLEDRMVKLFMRDSERTCVCPPEIPVCRCDHRLTFKRLSRKAIKAGSDEVARNPRSRSASLRAAVRVESAV